MRKNIYTSWPKTFHFFSYKTYKTEKFTHRFTCPGNESSNDEFFPIVAPMMMLWFLIFFTIILSHVIITGGERKKNERKKTIIELTVKAFSQYRIYINSSARSSAGRDLRRTWEVHRKVSHRISLVAYCKK